MLCSTCRYLYERSGAWFNDMRRYGANGGVIVVNNGGTISGGDNGKISGGGGGGGDVISHSRLFNGSARVKSLLSYSPSTTTPKDDRVDDLSGEVSSTTLVGDHNDDHSGVNQYVTWDRLLSQLLPPSEELIEIENVTLLEGAPCTENNTSDDLNVFIGDGNGSLCPMNDGLSYG